MAPLELRPTAVVAGGSAIARDADGAVVFVEGALPGERVLAELTEHRRDFRRAAVVDVLEPSVHRVAPPCPNVARGCGGCGWQHVTVDGQRRLKEQIVADALRRLAKLDVDDVGGLRTVGLAEEGFRTTVRVAVEAGRARFRRRGSAELVEAQGCLVAHPLVADVLDHGEFGAAAEAVVRAGVASGERAALLRPTATGARLGTGVVIGGAVHEEVAGRRLRVSIRSFFQPSPEAAAAIAGEVVRAVRGDERPVASVADLYAGVGVLGGVVAATTGAELVAVERGASAVADARRNLGDLAARVVRSDVARWRPGRRFDLVVADPARPGLAGPGVAAVLACEPEQIVLVSCDPASMARDVALLAGHGWRPAGVVLVDAFPSTAHVEVVTKFHRGHER